MIHNVAHGEVDGEDVQYLHKREETRERESVCVCVSESVS
jgi:hypothetical protein